MTQNIARSRLLLFSVSSLALAAASPALAQDVGVSGPDSAGMVEEVVVTAQRRAESLQNVPISVSAFSEDVLAAQKVETGANLQLAVPNVTVANSARGYNFQIRGVGTKQVAVSGDTSTGVHFNNAPLTDSRVFEAEFFDVERVEVLRGPQGTLYGRNATGGVINVITAKPVGVWEGMIGAEAGNFDTRKIRGMVNVPLLEDKLMLRLAGNAVRRSGFVTNALDGGDLDDRNFYAVRATLAFNPTDRLETSLIWQRFEEDDSRLLTGKALCVRDPGPASVGGVAVSNSTLRSLLSQGCANASLDSANANGAPYSATTLYGLLALRSGLATDDLYAGKVQSGDPDLVESHAPPHYRAEEDIFELNVAFDLTDALKLHYLGSYSEASTDAGQDAVLFSPTAGYSDTPLAPGGFYQDPQLGASNQAFYYNTIQRPTRQTSHEVRLASDFDSSVNFSVGANYLKFELDQNIYIMSHAFTHMVEQLNGSACETGSPSCIVIDPSPTPTGIGHNYYRAKQPYELESRAVFGEVYWKLTEDVKLTGGLRYTDDKKTLYNYPVGFLTPGEGVPPGNPASYTAEFGELAGRVGVDWKADLPFTDSTLLYAFYSRGYKGGGPNNIGAGGFGGARQFYDPEFVNSYEIGAKNALLGGAVILNASLFMYDYEGYQISKYVNRIAVTENVDAKISGLEIEGLWEPIRGLRFNMAAGLLSTEIQGGTSIDAYNRSQGDPDWTLVKSSSAGACLAPTEALGDLVAIIEQQPGAPTVAGVSGAPLSILGVCSGTFAGMGVTPIDGIDANLAGNELPNSPKWTVSVGAQYTWQVLDGWDATIRGDYFEQGASYARPYNEEVDRLPGWKNLNLSVKLAQAANDLQFEFYVKNALNDRPIIDNLYNDDALGLLPRAFLLEPRTYALSVTKRF